MNVSTPNREPTSTSIYIGFTTNTSMIDQSNQVTRSSDIVTQHGSLSSPTTNKQIFHSSLSCVYLGTLHINNSANPRRINHSALQLAPLPGPLLALLSSHQFHSELKTFLSDQSFHTPSVSIHLCQFLTWLDLRMRVRFHDESFISLSFSFLRHRSSSSRSLVFG